MQHIYWKVGQIFAIFKNFWGITVPEPPKSIRMSALEIYNKFVRHLMIYKKYMYFSVPHSMAVIQQ